MKKLFTTLLLLFIAQVGMAQEDAFKKDVLKVLEMSGANAQIKVAKDQIVKMIPADKQSAFTTEFEATMPGFYDKMAKIYMETYTKEDIKAMIAFYETPVGKKMTEKSAELFQKSQLAGQDWGKSLQTIMMKYLQ